MATAVQSSTPPASIDLAPFRRRIKLLRAWRLAALGGSLSAVLSIAAIALDRAGVIDSPDWIFAALPLLGVLSGAGAALAERYDDSQVARSIDRRSTLDERLTTLYESNAAVVVNALGFYSALRTDTVDHMSGVSAKRLYPLRFLGIHWLFLGLLALCGIIFLAFETPLLKPLSARIAAKQMEHSAVQVQQIARPFVEQAKQPNATPEDNQLAQDLQKFANDLRKDRLSKEEALIRANQLAEQAKNLEMKRSLSLSRTLNTAQTAGAKLQQMVDQAKMQKTDAAKLADQAETLQQKIAALQHQLDAAKAGQSKLSKAQQNALAKKLDSLQKQLQQIKLSQQAQETLEKLQSMPAFQQAQALLSQMQQQQQQNGQMQQITQEQAKAMAAQLEALAKQLNTDAKMRAYANALLQMAMQMRLNAHNLNLSGKLAGLFGMGGLSLGFKGQGAATPDKWVGDHGSLSHFDKSSLLHIKFQDRVITSQQGKTGPSTYTELTGPAQLTPKSGIPYQNVLPKYEKSAESALSRGNIPPEMRTRVRDYFNSLHQGQ